MLQKKGLHIHQLTDFNIQNISGYNIVVLGGVFCPILRVDNNMKWIAQICEKIKGENKLVRIYIQQPFYLLENSGPFSDFINNTRNMELIDGVLVNSPGAVRHFSEDTEIIVSRFTVGKRKRVNRYFYDLLSGFNVIAVECFAGDSELIEDVREHSNLPLWIREGEGRLYSFSSKCILEKYLGYCTNKPDKCASGAYFIKSSKHNARFVLSGHSTYTGTSTPVHDYLVGCDSIIYNAGGFEI